MLLCPLGINEVLMLYQSALGSFPAGPPSTPEKNVEEKEGVFRPPCHKPKSKAQKENECPPAGAGPGVLGGGDVRVKIVLQPLHTENAAVPVNTTPANNTTMVIAILRQLEMGICVRQGHDMALQVQRLFLNCATLLLRRLTAVSASHTPAKMSSHSSSSSESKTTMSSSSSCT